MKKKKPVYEGKMRLKKNDEVIVIAGKSKDKRGKVIEVLAEEGKVRVEGVNVVKKHQKPRSTSSRAMVQQQLGEVQYPMGIGVNKVMLVCPKCNKETRMAMTKGPDGSSVRKCRKCGDIMDG